MMDDLARDGSIVWWRPSARRLVAGRPTNTVAASPICILPRSGLRHWQALAEAPGELAALSLPAARVYDLLASRGAQFFADIVTATALLRVQVEDSLSELVAQGLVSSDAFVGLRAVLAPQRDRAAFHGRRRARSSAFDRAGRWALVAPITADEFPALRTEACELAAQSLLRRYGVVTRVLAARESLAPPWRELVRLYRRWEASGEIRGGRFVEPFGGEQFALSEAVEALRRTRRESDFNQWISISAADPLNLAGTDGGQKRIPAIGANRLVYANGVQIVASIGNKIDPLLPLDAAEIHRATALLRPASSQRRPGLRR
jgi:ATP-dependent Lhr-like helicase